MDKLKSGFVGIIGLPNAGKSSFLNKIISEKVAIVTPKPQTTRRRVLGIYNEEPHQIVFVDSPGLVAASNKLNTFLREEMDSVVNDSDSLLVLLNLDAEKPEHLKEIIEIAIKSKKPHEFVITKNDIEAKLHRRPIIENLLAEFSNKKAMYFSTQLTKEDFEIAKNELIEKLLVSLPPSDAPLYDPEIITPHSVRELSAEIVREKCFENLHHEVPYSIAIRVRSFSEEPSITKISMDILVERESHKPMVIGKAAETIKKIGSAARTEIEKLVDQKVFLDLNVVHREGWTMNTQIMKELGYVVSDT